MSKSTSEVEREDTAKYDLAYLSTQTALMDLLLPPHAHRSTAVTGARSRAQQEVVSTYQQNVSGIP